MNNFNIKKEKGITLIALIITIIILVILAAVSIRAVYEMGIVGYAINGIQQYAEQAKVENQMLGKTGNTIDSALAKLKEIQGESSSTGVNGSTTIPQNLSDLDEIEPLTDEYALTQVPDIANYIKVGDYVAYDPLHKDLARTQAVESSKLTYTSPTGTGQSHGNGYTSSENGEGQTFTVKSGINWRIFSISPDIVELIPENPIKKDDIADSNGDFVLNGSIGYLYAEQELHEACKIYGYGYGTYKGQAIEFNLGGPLDTDQNGNILKGTLNNVGSRSLTVDDIYRVGNRTPTKYNNTIKTGQTYIPTIDTVSGISETREQLGTFIWYSYQKSLDNFEDNVAIQMLQNEAYLLASRAYLYNANHDLLARICAVRPDVDVLDGYGVCDEILLWCARL